MRNESRFKPALQNVKIDAKELRKLKGGNDATKQNEFIIIMDDIDN